MATINSEIITNYYEEIYVNNSTEPEDQIFINELNKALIKFKERLDSFGATYNGNEISEENRIESLPATLKVGGYDVEIKTDQSITVKDKASTSSGLWSIGGQKQQVQDKEISEYNKEFELYADTNSSGATTKGLMTVISDINEGSKYKYKIKEIHFNGSEYEATKENIVFVKGDIALDKIYKVEFERDSDTGVIFRVVINEK